MQPVPYLNKNGISLRRWLAAAWEPANKKPSQRLIAAFTAGRDPTDYRAAKEKPRAALPKPKFRPGTQVVREYYYVGAHNRKYPRTEYGVVIANFWDAQCQWWDCQVAFYGGKGFPKERAAAYLAYYLESSLKRYKEP